MSGLKSILFQPLMMFLASIPHFAALGVASVLLCIYKLVIYPALLSPLAKIPAARWHARFCPLWSHYIQWANVENQTVYQLHRKYGAIVRMGPAELSVNCYEGGLKTIYVGGFQKTDFYANRFNTYGHGPMFTMIESKEHYQRKRMLSNIYSKSVVLSSPTIRATSRAVLFERLLPVFQESSDTYSPVEVHKLNYAYAMDSFTGYQFGLKLGSNFIQNIEEREWYLQHFFSSRPYLFWTTEVPRLTERLLKLGIRVVPKWCDESAACLEKWNLDICDRAENLLSEDLSPDPENWPAIYATGRQKFHKADTKSGYTDKQKYPRRLEIASEMYDHNAAAIETSGDTLTWLYYEMSLRPDLQARLREELQTLDPPIEFPPMEGQQQLPDLKAVDSLSLLDAIMQETLRLWAAIPGGQPRVTPFPSCSLAGYDDIPPGVRVQSAAYTLHRNPEVFPEPETWKPERWINATPAELTEMRHWFWAWGSGGQRCIGSNVALHTMKLAIAGIYTNYTTIIVDADGIEQDEGFIAGPKGNKLWLQFKHV